MSFHGSYQFCRGRSPQWTYFSWSVEMVTKFYEDMSSARLFQQLQVIGNIRHQRLKQATNDCVFVN